MEAIVNLLRAQSAFASAKAPTAQEVAMAEQTLGVTFAADYRDYVTALGVASYEGHELTGVCPFPRLNVVSVTRQERAANPAIPSSWYVLAGCVGRGLSGDSGACAGENLRDDAGVYCGRRRINDDGAEKRLAGYSAKEARHHLVVLHRLVGEANREHCVDTAGGCMRIPRRKISLF